MRVELRVCRLCYDGEHGDPEKAAITRDMVKCAERVREYKDLIGIDSLYITFVTEGDTGGAEAIPVITASLAGNTIQLADTQLVMEDNDGSMLVYPNPADVLGVLTRNLQQINEQTRQDVSVELTETSLELL